MLNVCVFVFHLRGVLLLLAIVDHTCSTATPCMPEMVRTSPIIPSGEKNWSIFVGFLQPFSKYRS
jgi:hypothetical protein